MLARDRHGRPIVLFRSEWELSHSIEKNPELTFSVDPDGPESVSKTT